jgi:hypothetical protein
MGLHVQLNDVVEFFRRRSGASGSDSKAALLVQDLIAIPDAAEDLSRLVAVIQMCVKRYYESDNPELTNAEISHELQLTAVQSLKVYELIHSQFHVTKGSYGT